MAEQKSIVAYHDIPVQLQALQSQVKTLQKENTELKARIERLEKTVKSMRNVNEFLNKDVEAQYPFDTST